MKIQYSLTSMLEYKKHWGNKNQVSQLATTYF